MIHEVYEPFPSLFSCSFFLSLSSFSLSLSSCSFSFFCSTALREHKFFLKAILASHNKEVSSLKTNFKKVWSTQTTWESVAPPPTPDVYTILLYILLCTILLYILLYTILLYILLCTILLYVLFFFRFKFF